MNTSVDSDGEDKVLLDLIRAIASGLTDRALELLVTYPGLATQSVKTGATRTSSTPFYFEEIPHYVYEGDTALHVASAAYRLEIVDRLVANGASPAARNRRGAEPLHYAADGAPGSPGWNPAKQGAVIERLIEEGANPDSLDKSGVGPLHRAVRTRSAAAVRTLLAKGADKNLKNKSGSTPLHLAVQNTGRGGSGSSQAHELQKEIVLLLLQYGARLEDKDARGKTVRQSIASQWILDLIGPH